MTFICAVGNLDAWTPDDDPDDDVPVMYHLPISPNHDPLPSRKVNDANGLVWADVVAVIDAERRQECS